MYNVKWRRPVFFARALFLLLFLDKSAPIGYNVNKQATGLSKRRAFEMKSVKIRLSTVADVRDFVNILAKTDIEIDLASGRYVVDGKSIMGIFSLDLLSPITLTAHSDDTDDLFADIALAIIDPRVKLDNNK